MASHKTLTVWSLIGSIYTIFILACIISISIPDFPRNIPLWQSMTSDPTGYWHELFYILVGWISGMLFLFIWSLWYAMVRFLQEIRVIGLLPDGNIVLYKVKKRQEKG